MKNNSAHALFFEGDWKSEIDTVTAAFAPHLKGEVRGNPDIVFFLNPKLSIEVAREIKEFSNVLPVSEDYFHIVIGFHSANIEAQNALLKAFEEPGSQVKLFLMAPSFKNLLPTLRSRVIAQTKVIAEKKFQKEAEQFLKAGKGKRILMAEKMADDVKSEIYSKADVADFLRALEAKAIVDHKANKELLITIGTAFSYLESSSSLKQLLSLVALA